MVLFVQVVRNAAWTRPVLWRQLTLRQHVALNLAKLDARLILTVVVQQVHATMVSVHFSKRSWRCDHKQTKAIHFSLSNHFLSLHP